MNLKKEETSILAGEAGSISHSGYGSIAISLAEISTFNQVSLLQMKQTGESNAEAQPLQPDGRRAASRSHC